MQSLFVSLIQLVEMYADSGLTGKCKTHHLIGHTRKHTHAPENTDHSSVLFFRLNAYVVIFTNGPRKPGLSVFGHQQMKFYVLWLPPVTIP